MTILVVDDEEDVRCFLTDILEDVGFDVMSACDGVEALERVKEKTPDLISLDLVMPNKSGIRFLHELRRNRKWVNIPVVVVTAHAHDDLGRSDFQDIFGSRSLAGPKVYLEKPVEPESYARLVCESLGVEAPEPTGTNEASRLREELEQLTHEADPAALAEAIRLLKTKR
jgi:CheY-like chemotaxis protein